MKVLVAVLFAFSLSAQASTVELEVDDTANASVQTDASSSVAELVEDWGHLHGQINCREFPGRRVCSDIRMFDSLLGDCTGAGCYGLWHEQMRTVRSLSDYYYDNVAYGAETSEEAGRLSERTARRLCGIRVTGPADYVSRLTVTYNRMVQLLVELQENAGIRRPYSCKFVIK